MRAQLLKQAAWVGFSVVMMTALARVEAFSPVGLDGGFRLAGGCVGASTDEDLSFDNLDVVDASLKGKMAVLRVGSEVGENKLLTVFAGLKNKTGHHLDLEIETIYKDQYGNALNQGSWIAFSLAAHEEREYHSSSISVAATDFLVRVRRAVPTTAHN